jgi:hypothetical protein
MPLALILTENQMGRAQRSVITRELMLPDALDSLPIAPSYQLVALLAPTISFLALRHMNVKYCAVHSDIDSRDVDSELGVGNGVTL